MIITINLPEFLAQWWIHENGGVTPVKPRKGSVEEKIVETFVTDRPPITADQCDRGVAVAVATSADGDSLYLPKKATSALIECIRNRFDVQLFSELHRFGNIGSRQEELVYAWMERHGIDTTARNWESVVKRYQRQRRVYADRDRKLRGRGKKHN